MTDYIKMKKILFISLFIAVIFSGITHAQSMIISKDAMIREADVIAVIKIIEDKKHFLTGEIEQAIKGNPETKMLISKSKKSVYLKYVKEEPRYLVFLKTNKQFYEGYEGAFWKHSFLKVNYQGKVLWPNYKDSDREENLDLDLVITEISDIVSQQARLLRNVTMPVKLWEKSLDGIYTYSGTVVNELIIVGVRSKEGPALEARRLSDGALEWKYKEGGVIGAVYRGKVIVSALKEIIAVDAATGEEQWRFNPETPGSFSSPAVLDGDVLYIADYCPDPRKKDAVGPSNFYCLSAATGEELWSVKIPTGAISSPVSFDSRNIYVVREYGFSCISKKKRRVAWSMRIGPAARASAYPNGEFVIVPAQSLLCLSVKDGKLLWKIKGMPNEYSGRLADGILYTALSYKFYLHYFAAVQADAGKIIWQCKFPDWVRGGAAFDDTNIYTICWDNYLYCLDRQKGYMLWRYPVELDKWALLPLVTSKGILLCFKDKIICVGWKK